MAIQALENHGIKLQVAFLSNSYYNWDKYIQDGIAYGIVGSDYMTNNDPDKAGKTRTRFIPFKENILTSHFLLTKKKALLNPCEKVFLEIVRDHYINTIQNLTEYEQK